MWHVDRDKPSGLMEDYEFRCFLTIFSIRNTILMIRERSPLLEWKIVIVLYLGQNNCDLLIP